MQSQLLDPLRESGMLARQMSHDIAELSAADPEILRNNAAMAAALRGLGYSAGEVDARLFMAGRVEA